MRPATFSILLCFTLNIANSARILGVVNLAAYSHYSLGLSLMKELAAKGHDVTYISPYTEKNVTGKFRSIELTGFHDEMEEMKTKLNMFEVFASRAVPSLLRLHSLGLGITDKTLAHENIQKLLASNEQFDVIIIEQFINEALHGFCHHFKAPCIKLSPVRSCYWTNNFVGNPSNPAYIPEFSLGHSGPMNLYQRIQNTALHITTELLMHFHILPQQNELMHRYFPNAPPLRELLDDTPLVLLNSHVSTAPPMPHVPNMIEIGGYHVQPPKKLPEDLQKYLDGAKEGVVYFSMGSNLRSREIPVAKREAILRAFSKLKYKVLWKFEEDDLPGKPGNVMIKKWLPQQDILAHPNIKLFITHGGLLSTIEAIYHGVPVIGIPIFGDQVTNMLQAVQAGFGISLEYATLNEEIFSAALNEILSNLRYTKNVKQRSRVMHDQPMKPIDTATFWVEYVARHKGAKHFRSAAMDLAWYQLLQLDVAAAILFLAITVLSICIFIMKTMFASDSSKVKVAEKKNK